MNCDSPFKILSIGEVANRLNLKDTTTATKWLKENEITIHRLPKISIYEIDLHCALALPLAKDYKRKHKENWKNVFKYACPDESIYNIVLSKMNIEPEDFIATTSVKTTSDKEKKLKQKLLS